MIKHARRCIFLTSISWLLLSCGESESRCVNLVQDHVVIPYRVWNPQSTSAQYYERYGPMFIVFVTSGEFVPFSTISQEYFQAHVYREGMAMLPIGDLRERECPAEVERVVQFAKQWNDRMYFLM